MYNDSYFTHNVRPMLAANSGASLVIYMDETHYVLLKTK